MPEKLGDFVRILTMGMNVVSDSCLFCGHFSFCQVALSSFDILVCAWTYCGLLCCAWMTSLEGLLFSERRLWGLICEREEVEKRDWEGGQKGGNYTHDRIYEKITKKT